MEAVTVAAFSLVELVGQEEVVGVLRDLVVALGRVAQETLLQQHLAKVIMVDQDIIPLEFMAMPVVVVAQAQQEVLVQPDTIQVLVVRVVYQQSLAVLMLAVAVAVGAVELLAAAVEAGMVDQTLAVQELLTLVVVEAVQVVPVLGVPGGQD